MGGDDRPVFELGPETVKDAPLRDAVTADAKRLGAVLRWWDDESDPTNPGWVESVWVDGIREDTPI